MNQPHSSLVKYDNPILVSTTKDKKSNKKSAAAKALAAVEASKVPTQTEDILVCTYVMDICIRTHTHTYIYIYINIYIYVYIYIYI